MFNLLHRIEIPTRQGPNLDLETMRVVRTLTTQI